MKPGWTASLIEGHDWLRVFTAPNADGHVTVDYKARGFRTGISSYGTTRPGPKYRGRGWRDRLEHDAIAYLDNLLYGTDAASSKGNADGK